MPLALLAVSAAGTIYGAVQQHDAASRAGQLDTATANYNAKIDESEAAQLDLDAQQNIRTERQDAAVYLSRQASSYAAAGVLANTGSALDAQILNAGRFEQKIQQDWVNTNQQQKKLYASAKVGRLEGAAKRETDMASGQLALVNGGIKLTSTAIGAYNAGIFS